MTEASAPELDSYALLTRVRELVQSIDGYVHLTAAHRRRINTAATLPAEFFDISTIALDTYDWLARVAQISGDDVRRMLTESPAIDSLATELETLARGLRSTNAMKRASVGERLLLMYEIARRHNRSPLAESIPQVALLEEILRRRRGKRARRAVEAKTEEPAVSAADQSPPSTDPTPPSDR